MPPQTAILIVPRELAPLRHAVGVEQAPRPRSRLIPFIRQGAQSLATLPRLPAGQI